MNWHCNKYGGWHILLGKKDGEGIVVVLREKIIFSSMVCKIWYYLFSFLGPRSVTLIQVEEKTFMSTISTRNTTACFYQCTQYLWHYIHVKKNLISLKNGTWNYIFKIAVKIFLLPKTIALAIASLFGIVFSFLDSFHFLFFSRQTYIS